MPLLLACCTLSSRWLCSACREFFGRVSLGPIFASDDLPRRAEFRPKFSNERGRFIDEDEIKVSAEIGCAPPISQPLREFIRCLMNTVPHDFVTVDMRGLKTALVAHAQCRQVSVSVVVREALASVLPSEDHLDDRTSEPAFSQVKLSIRFDADNVVRLDRAAKAAGLSRGAFLSGLIDGVPALSSGGRVDYISALIASNAELSTLSRNLRHLTTLLARSEMQSAQRYRHLLDEVAGDVRRHLEFSGQALKELRPTAISIREQGRVAGARRSSDV